MNGADHNSNVSDSSKRNSTAESEKMASKNVEEGDNVPLEVSVLRLVKTDVVAHKNIR